ncbi:MAG: signal recognition particle protein [Planctomycetaceae bacterium]|nr:signal recognition particle protein [Planctomycetaceae bacterium]
MFESLNDGLTAAFKTLRGKGKLTEANMRDGLALVERSLLEADVSYQVVQDFMAAVGEKAMGQKVMLALDPSEHLVGIVRDELVEILGPVDPSFDLRRDVTTLMLCGLQGSGKTTSCGKLARLLLNNKARPMLVAADLQRPAAIDQLHVLGEQLGIPVYSDRETKDPVKVCQDAVRRARDEGADVVILDTAGRLAIDQELMDELSRIDKRVGPDQCFLVVDGMTGQDAVNSAQAFNEALELNGVIMTKLDGDARGGALLSVKQVTGVPIKFIGTGEQLEALEPFRPEGMAERILGLGDILGLVHTAQQIVDEKEQQELQQRMEEGSFSLEDFKGVLTKFSQPGLMKKMVGLMPGMGGLTDMMDQADADGDVKRLVGIVDSMTPEERRRPKLLDASRRSRIARGAGVEIGQVTDLIKQFNTMAPIMQSMAGKGPLARIQAVKEMQHSGMLDPGAQVPRVKKGTGKRMSPRQRAQAKKQRNKELRRRRRGLRGRNTGE